jgi:hypothetical protein
LTDAIGNPVSGSLNAGNYKIVPGGATFITPSNYILVYKTGNLIVGKTPLKATVRDTSRLYGDPNPVFTISYSGFMNGDGPTKITPPVATTGANALSPVGTYPINLNGGVATNYTIQNIPGTLNIAPALLNVKADDKGINDDDDLPAFTSTITGFRNGENNTVTGGPSFTVNPIYNKEQPGVYVITPYGLQLSYQNNYTVIYQPGTLYVNNDNGKNVVPKLDCVEPLTNDPSGYPFAANFSYSNPNSTIVYVPVGVNNSITTTGHYSGQLPIVFQVGSGKFKIYFDGTKLTWTLITYNGNHSSSSAAVASSTSSKCSSGTGTTQTGVQSALATSETAEDVPEPPATSVYPNPTKGLITIYVKDGIIASNNVELSDSYGKFYKMNAKLITGHSLQVDLSGLSSGMYFIRVMVDGNYKIFRVLKM